MYRTQSSAANLGLQVGSPLHEHFSVQWTVLQQHIYFLCLVTKSLCSQCMADGNIVFVLLESCLQCFTLCFLLLQFPHNLYQDSMLLPQSYCSLEFHQASLMLLLSMWILKRPHGASIAVVLLLSIPLSLWPGLILLLMFTADLCKKIHSTAGPKPLACQYLSESTFSCCLSLHCSKSFKSFPHLHSGIDCQTVDRQQALAKSWVNSNSTWAVDSNSSTPQPSTELQIPHSQRNILSHS